MKKSGLLLTVSALVAFGAATSQAGLVSLYTFDDTANVGTNAVNAAWNGTANNVTSEAGAVGTSAMHTLEFNSDVSVSNLALPTTAAPMGLKEGTYSVWLKTASGETNLNGAGIDVGFLYSGHSSYVHWGSHSGDFDLWTGYGAGPGTMEWESIPTDRWPTDGQWHLLTTTWDGYDPIAGQAQAVNYIDGVATSMTRIIQEYMGDGWPSNDTAALPADAVNFVNINDGDPRGDHIQGMTGAYDDFGVWDADIAAAQVKALFDLGTSALDYNAKDADALFNLYLNGGSAVIGGQTWSKYGTGTAFDGTGALTGTTLALGATGGVQIGVPVVDVTWTGGTSAVWDTAATGNWKKTSDNSAAVYGNGVAVLFNDTATGLTASINAADVSPASVTFNNSTNAYVVNGTKGIVGTTGVLKQGTAKVTLSGVNSYSGVTTLETTGGTLQFNKAAAWNPVANLGGANIKAGKMIFDYTGESSPAATIGALLKTSYNSASSTHFNTGKFQSTTADTHHALGWKDSANQVTVAYTLYGDATVNGAVDISDLSALGQNWNGTGKVWAQGDFNYDGNVDISDLSALGQHWNQSIAGFSGSEGGAIVPEPSTLALLAAGLVGLLAYAWRKRK